MPEGLRLHGAPAAVTFDCWKTLIQEADWQLAHTFRVDALHAAAREAGSTVSREAAGRAFDAAWGRHMRLWQQEIASGAREIAGWALADLGLPAEGPAAEHLVANWQEASHTGRVQPLDGARETLAALRARGVRTALICDTGLTPGRVVREHLDHHGLLEHLEVQVFSDEVGVPKPSVRMFRGALDPLSAPAARSVHVGDLRRTDVAGARGVGMHAVRIAAVHDDTSDLPEADAVVADHAELRALLDACG